MTEHQRQVTSSALEGRAANGKMQRLLDALPADLRNDMLAIWEREKVPVGHILIEENAEAERIGFVLDGLLAMVKTLPDGRRHIIGLLTPADLFGRAFNGKSGYRIEALTDAELLTCPRTPFEELLTRSPEAERLFLLNVLDELDAAREWVMVLGSGKVVQRVASLLLILCRHKVQGAIAPRAPINLHIQLKRVDIAHLLGTSPESLSRSFKQLERDGIIAINTPYNMDVLDLCELTEAVGNALLIEDFGL
jgi:cAMP-binding proteins - catabolite gene activator and regulatory subunit of cAMP-dependent protein kinases